MKGKLLTFLCTIIVASSAVGVSIYPNKNLKLNSSIQAVAVSTVDKEYVMGDVNMDGQFNVSDVVLLQKWLLADSDTTLVDWKAADFCEDGILDVFDSGNYGTILICPEKNLLRCDNVHMGYSSSNIYKYENKKFVRLFYSYDDAGAVGETKASYHINDKEVTKEEYDGELSSYNNLNWISAGRKYNFNDFSALLSNTAEDNTGATDTTTSDDINKEIKRVSLGTGYSAYIAEDGSLYTWECNIAGGLGNGTTKNSAIPVKIMDNVVSISVKGGTCAAITTDGSLYTWGNNQYGQLGNGKYGYDNYS